MIHTLTAKELKNLINRMIKSGQIRENTEVWLSSDEEGNDFGPLVKFKDNGEYNVGVEKDKSRLTLYPVSV